MSKAYQYFTDDTKVYIEMKKVSIKEAQTNLQKTITWIKRIKRGREEWYKVCIEVGLASRKLNTPMKTRFVSKVIFFR